MTTETKNQLSQARAPRGKIVLAWSIPSLLLVAFFVYATWLMPISPFYANYDPEFQYLMNSLEVFKGAPYAYVDHPGTPVEMVGTAIYALTYPILGRGTDAFVRYHLENPGVFLTLAHGFVLFASIFCLWSFSSLVRSGRGWEDAVLSAALAAMYFALHSQSFSALTLWSHNSFGYALGALWLVVLFNLLHGARPDALLRVRDLIGLGLWAGILASITIYMAAWLLCLVVTLLSLYRLRGLSWGRTLGASLVASTSGLAGFGFAVVPSWNRMPAFFKGISDLLTHQGGAEIGSGQSLTARLAAGLSDLYSQVPILFISIAVWILLAGIALVVWRKRIHERPELWALALGLVAQITLLTVLILDHPRAIYMLSVAASVPILALVVLRIFEHQAQTSRLLNRFTIGFVSVAVVWSYYGASVQQQADTLRISRIVDQTAQAARQYAQALGRQPSDLYVLWTYRSYSPCFSLWFGNDSTGRVFRREVGHLCYRQYEFNIWSQKVVSGQGVSSLADAKWDLIVGCADGFKTPALASLATTESFPALQLECGSLTLGFNAP